MMKKISILTTFILMSCAADALEFSYDKWQFKLDADGMIGFLEPKAEKMEYITDWDVKGQILYNLNRTQKFGAVYSIDADCTDEGEYIHDAFILFEDRDVGRAEFGLTHSIARKMGLGLPDVGYLRVNNKSILHKKLDLKRVLISDVAATTGHESLRLNLATAYTDYGQYGISISGGGDDYDYALDAAVKLKHSNGKIKTAYSLAVSYMDNPEDYHENTFSPHITADSRSQIALGFNLQYNSWIWGTSARLIYDYKPIAKTADGLIVGTGLSYDFLQSSISLTYMFSDTNVWKHDDEFGNRLPDGDYVNTVLASFRYKYSPHTSLFMSGGTTDSAPFFAVGIKTGF